jgi:uncharacterized DUF497 family protein
LNHHNRLFFSEELDNYNFLYIWFLRKQKMQNKVQKRYRAINDTGNIQILICIYTKYYNDQLVRSHTSS